MAPPVAAQGVVRLQGASALLFWSLLPWVLSLCRSRALAQLPPSTSRSKAKAKCSASRPSNRPAIACEAATPPIACESPPEPGTGTCDAVAVEEEGLLFASLEAVPAEGSEFLGWVIEEGEAFEGGYCEAGNPGTGGENGEKCYVDSEAPEELRLEAVFAASAPPPAPTLHVSIEGEGEVLSISPFESTPPIACESPPEPGTGTCDAVAVEEEGLLFASLEAVPAEGSEFLGWVIEEGEAFEGGYCEAGNPGTGGENGEKCYVDSEAPEELRLEAVFAASAPPPAPTLHVSIEGEGEVLSISPFESTPPIACESPPEPGTGTCDAVAVEEEGLLFASLEAVPAEGSEFLGWVIEEGEAFEGGYCEAGNPGTGGENGEKCYVDSEAPEELRLEAVFAASAPPPAPTLHVSIEGEGEVLSISPFESTPPIACESPPEPGTGTCDAVAVEEEGLLFASLEAVPAEGSEFLGWVIEEGEAFEGGYCEAGNPGTGGENGEKCYVDSEAPEELRLEAVFAASAPPPAPTLHVSIEGEGEVLSISPFESTPPIACESPPEPGTGTCDAVAVEEEGLLFASLEAVPAEGSEFLGWVIEEGEAFEGGYCEAGNPGTGGENGEKCYVDSEAPEELRLEAVFAASAPPPAPTLHVSIEGEGEVLSISPFESTPPIACESPPEPGTGTCDAVAVEEEGLLFASLEAVPAEGSEFLGWVIEEGEAFEGGYCEAGNPGTGGENGEKCYVDSEAPEELRLEAVFAETPLPAPTVSSLSPTHGPAAGNTEVTITGTNLTGASAVHFGAESATEVTPVDATHVTAKSPSGTAGTEVDVTVTTPGGTSATNAGDKYAYDGVVPAPTVSSLSPTHGPAAGNTEVTITGTNLTGASAVHFGAESATEVTPVDATHVTAKSPSGTAGTEVDVTVTTPGGTSATNAGDKYAYDGVVPAPTVSSLSPTHGPAAGNTEVTITGTNLTGASAVHFGAESATEVTPVDATHVTAKSPSGTAGTEVDVTVTTPGGTSATNAGDKYAYDAAPPITHTLTINKAGTGSGSVTCNGGACASSYNEGTSVTLAATAASGSTFAGWSGGGCSGTGNCVVTLNADTTVTATFNKEEVTPPPTEGIARAAGTAQVKSGKALLKLTCSGGACKGSFKLTAKVKQGKKKTVTVGKGSFSIAVGKSKTIKVKITNGQVKKELSKGRTVTVQLKGSGIKSRTIKLKPAKKKNKRSHKRHRRQAG